MLPFGRAGVAAMEPMAGFALPSEPVIGNNNPAWTGTRTGPKDRPGPHPATQPMGGQTGDYDPFYGRAFRAADRVRRRRSAASRRGSVPPGPPRR